MTTDQEARYAQLLQQFLEDYVQEMYSRDPSGIENHVIVDPKGKHFQLLRVGWTRGRHIFGVRFHFDLKDDKVWVQANNTEEMIGDELIKYGIAREDIVLAFHPPELRVHTGFGVG